MTEKSKENFWEVGYVQAPNHREWANDFNLLENEPKFTVIDRKNLLDALAAAFFENLDERNLTSDPRVTQWLVFSGGKPSGFRLRECLLSESQKLGPDWLRIEAAAVNPSGALLTFPWSAKYFQNLRATRDLTDDKDGGRESFLNWYRVFVILGQIQIAFFFTYMLWLLLKVHVYFTSLHQMFPDERKRSSGEPRFSPYVYDPIGRFGLGALFAPYNLLVLIIAVGSSYFALNLPDSNVYRAITHAEGAGSDVSRVAHIFAILSVTAGVLIGPMWLYPRKLSRWTEERYLKEIRGKIRNATDAKVKNDLLEQESTIQKQSTWPKGDNLFRL